MREIRYQKQYIKDWKRYRSNPRINRLELEKIIDSLSRGEVLAEKYHDHALKGRLIGYRECHFRSDILLVYKITDQELIIFRIGSHSELFE